MTQHVQHAIATFNALLARVNLDTSPAAKQLQTDIIAASHGLIVVGNHLANLEELTQRQAAELDAARRGAWEGVGE